MKTHTDVQIIRQGGKPAFAVIPYEQYIRMLEDDKSTYVPNEVITLQFVDGLSMIAAWRTYKKMSQQALADKMGVSQPAVAQMEKSDTKPRRTTLEKAAMALGITLEHLTD